MARVVASVWTWFVLAASFAVLTPLMAVTLLLTAPFDRRRLIVGRMFRWIGIITGTLCPYWRFTVAHAERRDPRRQYVFVANHESFVDIFLLSHLPWEMKWMAKAELFRIPVMGWCLTMAGDIPVTRGDRKSGVVALHAAKHVIDRGGSVLIFPEGTRSTSGDLLPFKDGAFRLAIELGMPVLPLAISGSATALRKHDWKTHPSHAVVEVLEPVETTGLEGRDARALADQVHARIRAARHARLGGAPTPALQSSAT
ncbi:MAG: lysophospholipid acyltransferase family protein [Gemmatimonadales bacterium]|nr:lysophospholipid acyltransferase family protein [Gemmatimonadales bacterium]